MASRIQGITVETLTDVYSMINDFISFDRRCYIVSC